jgi:hypothetical protein
LAFRGISFPRLPAGADEKEEMVMEDEERRNENASVYEGAEGTDDNGTQEDADRSGQRPGAGDVDIPRSPVDALGKEGDYEKGDPNDPSTGAAGDPGIHVPETTQSGVAIQNQEHREEVMQDAEEKQA